MWILFKLFKHRTRPLVGPVGLDRQEIARRVWEPYVYLGPGVGFAPRTRD